MTTILASTDLQIRRRFERRMGLVYVASFGTVGVFNPFFPVWMASMTLTPGEIGLVIAAQIGLRVIVCPFILKYADGARDRAFVLIALGAAAAVLVNLLYAASGFAAILVVTLLIAAVWSPAVPLADAVALAGVRRLSADYGRSRLWGSVAFILGNILAGAAVSHFGPAAILPVLSLTFAGAALVNLLTPRLGAPKRVSAITADGFSEPFVPSRAGGRFTPKPDIFAILPALIAIALVQASHAAFYAFGSIVWTRLGYSGSEIGLLWAVGVTAEVILFRLALRLVARFGARAFLVAGGLAATLRWCVFGLDPGLVGFAVVQALHGLSFGATHLALQATILGSVPEERLGSAQGTAFALQTGAVAAVTLISGPAFAAVGDAMFFLMAGLAASGCLIGAFVFFPPTYPHKTGRGGETFEPE